MSKFQGMKIDQLQNIIFGTIFKDFIESHGDRNFGDDKAI